MLRPLVSVSGCGTWELTWWFSWLIYSISHVSSSLLLFTPLICLSSLSSANPSNLHPIHALTLPDFLGDFWPWVCVLVLGSKRRRRAVQRMSAWHLQQKGFDLIHPDWDNTFNCHIPGPFSFFVRQLSLNDYSCSILTKGFLSSDFQTTPLVGLDVVAEIDRMCWTHRTYWARYACIFTYAATQNTPSSHF